MTIIYHIEKHRLAISKAAGQVGTNCAGLVINHSGEINIEHIEENIIFGCTRMELSTANLI